MEYRAKGSLEWLSWILLSALIWAGVIGIAWNLIKPGGWLYWTFDLIERDQPTSFYHPAVGVLGLLAGKIWLDSIDPRAVYHLLNAAGAFAGTLYILSLLPQL